MVMVSKRLLLFTLCFSGSTTLFADDTAQTGELTPEEKALLQMLLKPAETTFGANGEITIEIGRKALNNLSPSLDLFDPKPGQRLSKKSRFRSGGRQGGGVRVTRKGQALLNCWLLGDWQAETKIRPIGTSRNRLSVFRFGKSRKGGTELGMDYRGKTFVRGKLRWVPKPLPEMLSRRPVELAVTAKRGRFVASRNDVSSPEIALDRSYGKESGRIGFEWSNSQVLIQRLRVTGKLDIEKMKEVLRDYARKKKGRTED